MRPDDDFSGYVDARWPSLVRTLVLLGCPESAAPDVALDAVSRCQRGWRRIREDGDVDGVVRGELLAAWHRFRSSDARWWDAPAPAIEHDPTLSADLDALNPHDRRELVLARFCGAPSAAVLPSEPSAQRMEAAAARLPVLAPPGVETITAVRRAGERRRTRRAVARTLAVALPVLMVAVAVTWATERANRTDPDALPRLDITWVQNPTNVDWEAGGVLHLQLATVTLPPARQVSPMGAGAIYADLAGRVIRVDADGSQTVLGREDTAAGFVASDAQGWVTWVEVSGGHRALMVVVAASGHVVGRAPVTRGQTVTPIAIDGGTVYYADGHGARGWQPEQQRSPAPVVEPASLVDVASTTRLYQIGHASLQVSQPLLGDLFPLTGVGGRLSPDGILLATRTSGDAGGEGPIAIYDTRTGASLQTGIAPDELAIDASFGDGDTVTYLIARRADRPSASDELRASFAGSLQLRTCQLVVAGDAPAQCDLVANIPVSGLSPMLGH